MNIYSERRLPRIFFRAKQEGRKVFTAYLTMGCPTLSDSLEIASTVLEHGADILELGVPFSDPTADGSVIQEAAQLALSANLPLRDILASAAALRTKHPDAGLVLFSYYNPVFRYGLERFVRDAAKAGIDALLIVDLPYEERDELKAFCDPSGLGMIPLISPATSLERIGTICADAKDFVYYITVNGVTGQRRELPPELARRLSSVRTLIPVPLVAGFGIANPETAQGVSTHCDGFVVGSALVEIQKSTLPKREKLQKIAGFVQALRRA